MDRPELRWQARGLSGRTIALLVPYVRDSLVARRIGFLLWQDPAVTMEHRQSGYERALAEAGLPRDPRLICEVVGYPTIDLEGIRRFLLAEPRPTAVFAANDQLALAVAPEMSEELRSEMA